MIVARKKYKQFEMEEQEMRANENKEKHISQPAKAQPCAQLEIAERVCQK